MTIQELRDAAIRHQIYLERLKVQTTIDFNQVYQEIEAKARELLSALDVTKLDEVGRSEIEAVIARLERASLKYGNGALDQLALDLTDYAKYAVEYEAAALSSVFVSTSARAVDAQKLMKAVMAQPVPLGDGTATLLGDMYSKLNNNTAKRLGNSIRNSWLRGDTVLQANRQVFGSKAAGFADGILNQSRRESAAVVHTSLQHLSTTARFETYAKNDDLVIGYRWISTLDGATTTQCRSLDGRRFLFKKAGYQPRPPLHVRCRSTTEPILNDGLDFLEKGATRSSREGYVDAKETYYDWLKRQSADEQQKILGATRAQLFQKGGLSAKAFADLNIDKNFQPMTLDEMKKAAPAAFKRAGLN